MEAIGTCLCGDVEFSVSGLSGNIYQCHCSLCRKQGGSASNTGTVVPKSQLTWLKGEEQIKSWEKVTGFKTSFCQSCGSLVPNRLQGSDYYWIPVGVLENLPFKIVANLYLESKAQWGVVSPSGEKFETMPELDVFIQMLGKQFHA